MKKNKSTRHVPEQRHSPEPKKEETTELKSDEKTYKVIPLEEPDDSEINEEGDCIGHWDENAEECSDCEIELSCRDMTENLKSMMSELTKDNGDVKEER